MENQLKNNGKVLSEDDVRLTKDEFEECLDKLELVTFLEAVHTPNPKSIYIFAQPGAGKTGLRMFAETEFYNQNECSNHVAIDPDQVAMFHKYYDTIIEKFPDDSYRLLQEFVRPALDGYLRQKAVFHKVHLFQEGTFASPGYIEIMDFQKNGGRAKIGKRDLNGNRAEVNVEGNYDIEINILAVHRYESLLSAYEREFELVEQDLPARAVTAKNHDYSYEKMLENIEKVEKRKIVNKMMVFKRGYVKSKPELVYKSGDTKYRSTAEAVRCEREKNKVELMSNSEAYLDRIAILRKKIKNKISRDGDFPNSDVLLDKIDAIEKEFIKDIEKSKIEGRGE